MEKEMEFSRLFLLRGVGEEATDYFITASVEECDHLAHRFELLSLSNLKAQFKIKTGVEPGSFIAQGKLEADVTQACVTSLQDVQSHISESIDIIFLPHEHKIFQDEQEMDMTQDFEPIVGDQIDLGEVVAQYLALALDPYPKHPVATHEGISTKTHSPTPHNPFCKLTCLRSNGK